MIKFFCDIVGTYQSENKTSLSREELVTDFVTNLERLTDEDISFSFCSTMNPEIVMNDLDELKKHLVSNRIHLDWQYSESKRLKDGCEEDCENEKISQIMEDLKEGKYSKIYYADDTVLLTKTAEKFLPYTYPELGKKNIVMINPDRNYGLESLNAKLSDIIKEKEQQKAL